MPRPKSYREHTEAIKKASRSKLASTPNLAAEEKKRRKKRLAARRMSPRELQSGEAKELRNASIMASEQAAALED